VSKEILFEHEKAQGYRELGVKSVYDNLILPRRITLMFKPTMLAEILKLIPDNLVACAVAKHDADRWRKSFFTRDHLTAMLAGQLSGADSLRGVATLFGAHCGQLYHLGCKPVRRATLAHANATRGWEVFATIASGLISRAGRSGRQVRDLMAALDSSPIRLCGRGNGWARSLRTRPANQGLKLHLRIGADSGSPEWLKVTNMTVNDITAAQDMPLEKGRIYLFDKGYCDYNWWADIINAKAHFITRLKKNAVFKVVRELDCDGKTILSDQQIVLTNRAPGGSRKNRLTSQTLRLVRIPHPAGKRQPFVIVSSLLDVPASEIADGYRRRWSIELVFKWLKQNLKIKRFVGENRNAVMVQIFIAIIAYMLVRTYHRLVSPHNKTRTIDFMTLIAANLFHPRPQPPPPKQHHHLNQPTLWEITP